MLLRTLAYIGSVHVAAYIEQLSRSRAAPTVKQLLAAIGMQVTNYYTECRRTWFCLYEKGGKLHEVPAHHNAADYVVVYIKTARTSGQRKSPLFRSI